MLQYFSAAHGVLCKRFGRTQNITIYAAGARKSLHQGPTSTKKPYYIIVLEGAAAQKTRGERVDRTTVMYAEARTHAPSRLRAL